jgi:hypothetical protein
MAKKKTKKKSAPRKQRQAEDPIGDFLKSLAKRARKGEIRGVLAIVIGKESEQNQIQWAGQVMPSEIMLPIATAQRVFVDIALNQGQRRQG